MLEVLAAVRDEDSKLDSHELEVLGTLSLGTPCITSHAEMDSNLDWGLHGVAEGGSQGQCTMNFNSKGMRLTLGRPRNKKGEHVRAGLKNSGRGRGQKVGDKISISNNEVVTNMENGSKRKGGAGCMHVDTEEGRGKRLKVDKVASTLSVTLATHLESVKVAGQPRRE